MRSSRQIQQRCLTDVAFRVLCAQDAPDHTTIATNFWGYNTIGFFAPHAGGQVQEFRDMVAALHAAGLDVLLDVVFNHTAEAGADGPVLCFRGLHDGGYYHLDAGGGYVDTTGCGNALNAGHPVALRLVMDALRYWVAEMGVDGFRFDLARNAGSTPARPTSTCRCGHQSTAWSSTRSRRVRSAC